MKFRAPLWYYRVFHYEFWPFWLLYFPAFFYWLLLALYHRSFTYFTAANPGIELGGFFGESKIGILEKIPEKYLPKSCYFEEGTAPAAILAAMECKAISFPVICKPDKGERGFLVSKLHSAQELRAYLSGMKGKLIVQEFSAYTQEYGILYYRFPDGSGSGISSVTEKEFLSVTGDGQSSVRDLLGQSVRARFRMKELEEVLGTEMETVLPAGEYRLIEPIGNHCRGTCFLNGERLISPELVRVFDEIAGNIPGIYFGRFDLKAKSAEDLLAGRHIHILELNGTTSEPAHIYDPSMNIFGAWKAIFQNMRIVSAIARQNKRNGISYTPFNEFFRIVIAHFRNKSANAR